MQYESNVNVRKGKDSNERHCFFATYEKVDGRTDELVAKCVLLRQPSQKHELIMGTSLQPLDFISNEL
jgi:hypothetical protein